MNEAELLLTDITKLSRAELYLNWSRPLLPLEQAKVCAAIVRRLNGEPIDYILGKKEFMGLEFKVNSKVLVPRPETEILTEEVLLLARKFNKKDLKILDVGTGSGCIAVTLAKMIPSSKISAVDISDKALAVAKENAQRQGAKIDFMQSDLFSALDLSRGKYDIIISNPPYIRSNDLAGLQVEVGHEPKIALDGGKDGLDFYRRIVPESVNFLNDGGILALEIGFDQLQSVKDIFARANEFEVIKQAKDYSGHDRVILAKVNKNG